MTQRDETQAEDTAADLDHAHPGDQQQISFMVILETQQQISVMVILQIPGIFIMMLQRHQGRGCGSQLQLAARPRSRRLSTRRRLTHCLCLRFLRKTPKSPALAAHIKNEFSMSCSCSIPENLALQARI